MNFEVAVPAKVAPSVRSALIDLVGSEAIRETPDRLVVTVVDQAALVGLIDRLHDLGVRIGEVSTRTSISRS